jgi:hypothetical protein
MATQFHLSEDALALHLLLQGFEGLIDVVIPNENLHLAAYSVTLHCGIKMSGAHMGPATEEAGLYHDHPMPQTLSKL